MKRARKSRKAAKPIPALIKAAPNVFDRLLHQVDNAPAPGPKLRALVRRKPAWQE